MLTIKHKRIASLLLVAAVCFAMLFSVCFIAAEAHHECSGENCIICAQISTSESILKSVFYAAIAIIALISAAYFIECVLLSVYKAFNGGTLITLKVELLN